MKRLRTAILAAATVGVATLGVAKAADDPNEVLAYREHVMGALASGISNIFAVLEGKTSYAGHLVGNARIVHEASLQVLDVFPEGSAVGDSRSKPEIWTDWAKFEEAGKALQTASADLLAAAEGGDMAAIGAAAGKVGEACGGCHKPFRKPQE
jgi:cytochrome c556